MQSVWGFLNNQYLSVELTDKDKIATLFYSGPFIFFLMNGMIPKHFDNLSSNELRGLAQPQMVTWKSPIVWLPTSLAELFHLMARVSQQQEKMWDSCCTKREVKSIYKPEA